MLKTDMLVKLVLRLELASVKIAHVLVLVCRDAVLAFGAVCGLSDMSEGGVS